MLRDASDGAALPVSMMSYFTVEVFNKTSTSVEPIPLSVPEKVVEIVPTGSPCSEILAIPLGNDSGMEAQIPEFPE